MWRVAEVSRRSCLRVLLLGGAGQVDGHLLIHVLLFLHFQEPLLLGLRLLGLAAAASFRGAAERIAAGRVRLGGAQTLLGHFQRLFVHPCVKRRTLRSVCIIELYLCNDTAKTMWKQTKHISIYVLFADLDGSNI